MRKRKILFHLNHPAHYHLFQSVITALQADDDYQVIITIVSKDVLEDLVQARGWPHVNLFPNGRRKPHWPLPIGGLWLLLKSEKILFRYVREMKPDLILGTEGTLAHIGWALKIATFLFNEDDTRATPENYLFYPFATKVIMPQCCDPKQWSKKKITYHGYHELAYLRPNRFIPNETVLKQWHPDHQPYGILRLAELTASHDWGKTGINDQLAEQLIEIMSKHVRVYITSERPLKPEFEAYRLPVPAEDIFHVLSGASIYVGDSQTMAAEAAVLGVPSIRFNDFVRKLSYLDELEDRYQLTKGITTDQPQALLVVVEKLLKNPHLKSTWQQRRQIMLDNTIDCHEFFLKQIESFFKQMQHSSLQYAG